MAAEPVAAAAFALVEAASAVVAAAPVAAAAEPLAADTAAAPVAVVQAAADVAAATDLGNTKSGSLTPEFQHQGPAFYFHIQRRTYWLLGLVLYNLDRS